MTMRRVSNAEMRDYDRIVQAVTTGYMRRLPRHYERDDIEAAARIGLFLALSRATNRDAQFEAYAYRRVRGAVRDELRAQDWVSRSSRERGAVAQFVSLDDEVFAAAHPPHAEFEVRSAVRALPAREAYVLLARFQLGLEFEEIAQQLGVSPARISQIKHDGLDRLAKLLGGPGRSDRVKPRPKRRKVTDGSLRADAR